ncbi:hypothetical protein FQN55_005709 [Onygenales sp. PD_40]|nr:hypothetical protein FQN55_005709 [Onygenales sp. PD_40]
MSSEPTIPAGQQSGASSGLSSPTQRRCVDVEAYKAATVPLRDILDSDDATDAIKQTVRDGLDMLNELAGVKDVKPMLASAVSTARNAAKLFGLHYGKTKPECLWEIPENGAPVHLTRETEHVLERMRIADLWAGDSAEALSRTFIDLVLFDLLEKHQEELAARKVGVIGEYQLQARTNAGVRVSGIADYVIGYEAPAEVSAKSLESYSIIVEAKKGIIDTGLGQAIAYMVAAQQHRLNLRPQKLVAIIYGIVSDGISWRFLRLDGKLLKISRMFEVTTAKDRQQIYLMVDSIIRASVESSPHTSPAKPFPETLELWREQVEAEIFPNVNVPKGPKPAISDTPEQLPDSDAPAEEDVPSPTPTAPKKRLASGSKGGSQSKRPRRKQQ